MEFHILTVNAFLRYYLRMKILDSNKPKVIGKRLWEWARMAQRGPSLADKARGRHNFRQLARDNPAIALEQSAKYGYSDTLKDLTPELVKDRKRKK
jgi:hypothetical protein